VVNVTKINQTPKPQAEARVVNVCFEPRSIDAASCAEGLGGNRTFAAGAKSADLHQASRLLIELRPALVIVAEAINLALLHLISKLTLQVRVSNQ
jgi:hypothetical protein